MISTKSFVVLALLVGDVAKPAHSAELQPTTIAAWQEYVRTADARMQARLDTDKPFLWIDETTDRALRVRGGEIMVMPMVGQGTRDVPEGLIHDWIGGVFIPNARIDKLLAVVHDYDRYKEIYPPVVTDSHSEARSRSRVFDDLETPRVVRQRRDPTIRLTNSRLARAADSALSTQPASKKLKNTDIPANVFCGPITAAASCGGCTVSPTQEQRDGGVYLEVEAIVLTSDVSPSLRWMVNPVVHRLSMNSLTTTLRQTRRAVNVEPVTPEQLAMRDAEGGN
jgi:hypothetical protein